MNEVVRLINILLIIILLFKEISSSKIKIKGKYSFSGANDKMGRNVNNNQYNRISNHVNYHPINFHRVFSVKTKYSNKYNQYSPLINPRIPHFIHGSNNKHPQNNLSRNNKIISQNKSTSNSPFTRPLPAEPFILKKTYNILPLQKNINNNILSSLKRKSRFSNENYSLPITNNNPSRIPTDNSNRESIFPLQLPSDLIKRILLRQKIIELTSNNYRNSNSIPKNSQVYNSVQKVYNPMPVMTHYNMPILHHIPVNQLVRRYIPVYYPVPIEHRINVPIQIPIKVPQRVLIPQAVPFGVKIPVPIPVKVEIPQYKEFQVQKPIYVKVPIYEHIPVYHHFAMTENNESLTNMEMNKDEDCDDNSSISNNNKKELNKQLNSFLRKVKTQ